MVITIIKEMTFVPVRFPFPNMFAFILTYFISCYVLFYVILQCFIADCAFALVPLQSVSFSPLHFFKTHRRPFLFVVDNLKYFLNSSATPKCKYNFMYAIVTCIFIHMAVMALM